MDYNVDPLRVPRLKEESKEVTVELGAEDDVELEVYGINSVRLPIYERPITSTEKVNEQLRAANFEQSRSRNSKRYDETPAAPRPPSEIQGVTVDPTSINQGVPVDDAGMAHAVTSPEYALRLIKKRRYSLESCPSPHSDNLKSSQSAGAEPALGSEPQLHRNYWTDSSSSGSTQLDISKGSVEQEAVSNHDSANGSAQQLSNIEYSDKLCDPLSDESAQESQTHACDAKSSRLSINLDSPGKHQLLFFPLCYPKLTC